ncbi:MAG: hypothetical protein WAK67_22520, partial [Xanthobacteraceae bacterium]
TLGAKRNKWVKLGIYKEFSGHKALPTQGRLMVECYLQIADSYGLSFAPEKFWTDANVTCKQTKAKFAAPNPIAK